MKTALILVWTLVIFGALIGGVVILITLKSEMNAIQQTSGFALGVSAAVVPYCFARAFTEIFGEFSKK